MAFDDFLISPMTKIARNCQNFDKFCAIFCIFKFCRLFFYFSVFIKISPFFFVFPTMTKLTPPHTLIVKRPSENIFSDGLHLSGIFI